MKKSKRIAALAMTLVLLLTSGVSVNAGISENKGIQNTEENTGSKEKWNALTREMAAEGMVLLKNENETLPIQKEEDKVAVFGRMQIDTLRTGMGAAFTQPEYEINVLQGLENAGVNLDEELAEKYRAWCSDPANKKEEAIYGAGYVWPEMPMSREEIQASKDAGANKAIVVIGRNAGEGQDISREYYDLTQTEYEMLQNVSEVFEHVIVVLNSGGVMDTAFVDELGIEAAVYMGMAGQEGGNALADILTAKVTPSGKTTDTFAKTFEDYPSSENFKTENDLNYEEDIFVGYRYFEQFDPEYEKVVYPFGYGLSYTTFAFGNTEVLVENDEVKISTDVTNTGDTYAGREVVQVYFSAPQYDGTEEGAKLSKPGKELAAFTKTKELEPGETQRVELSFPVTDMSSYDDTGATGEKDAWVMEAGDYHIYMGNSVKDAGAHEIYTYRQEELRIVESGLTPLPTSLEKRLRADGTYEELETIPQPGVHKIASSGINTIQAEDTFSKDSQVVEKELDEEGNACLENIVNGQSIVYRLKTEKSGKYRMRLHYSGNEQINLREAATISVGTANVALEDIELAPTDDYVFCDSSDIVISLPAGQADLKITSKSDAFVKLDYLTLENLNIPDPVTEIQADQPSKMEAEDFFEYNNNVRVEEFEDDGSGNPGACIAYMNIVGSYTSYRLNVEQAGTYDVKFRYANGNGAIALTDMASIMLNEHLEPTADWDITFDHTSVPGNTYHNFKTTENSIRLELPAGESVIKIISKNSNFANFDYLIFERVEDETKMAARNKTAVNTSESSKTILLTDVYENPELMDEFIAQLSIEDLAYLSGGHATEAPYTNTGVVGSLDKFGIPGMQTADGAMGLRLSDKETIAWPDSNILACTWDLDMAERFGVALGQEAKSYSVDCMLSPSVNIHRNPLGGRNFEYYSEDPFITGKMGAAVTVGQQSQGVAVTIKHYVANNSEHDRHNANSIVSARALREIYLKGFEIIVKEADPLAIMSGHNRVNGTKVPASYDLVTTIPRGEWGFQGIFMTDWSNSGTTHTEEVKSGHDVKMPNGAPDTLVESVNNGELTRQELERNVERILNVIMQTNAIERAPEKPEEIIHEISAVEKTRIKATEYSDCHPEIGSETCEDEGGGENPTNTNAGRYLLYKINVEESGTYQFDVRYSKIGQTGKFHLFLDNSETADAVFEPETTGGYQNWRTDTPGTISLTEGMHTIRLVFDVSGMNVNWFDFTPVREPETILSTDVLEYALELAEKADTTDVVDSVVKKFEEAKTNAQALLDAVNAGDTSVTQSQIDDSWRELIKVMQYLSFKQGDKTDLEKVIALAEGMNANISSYLEEGKDAFVKALEAAKVVWEDGDAMQEEVNMAWKNLLTAMAGLQKIPDKTALEDLLKQAGGLHEADYEAASYAVFSKALKNAENVYKDDQAAGEEVTAAKEELEGAIAKLVPVKATDENTVANTGTATSSANNTSADKKDTNTTNTADSAKGTTKSAKTGDEANAALPAAAGILAAVAAAFVWKKRR